MKLSVLYILRRAARYSFAGLLAASTFALAQDTTPPPAPDNTSPTASASSGGWKRVGDPNNNQGASQYDGQAPAANDPN
jgi:hypothetical protein